MVRRYGHRWSLVLALVVGCSGGNSGDGDGNDPPVDYGETDPPTPVVVTPEEGGTVSSAAGLLVVTIPPDTLASATELSVLRLTGADVPAEALLAIAHRLDPEPPYFNSLPTATWTIPASLVIDAYGEGATSQMIPLPMARLRQVDGPTVLEETLNVSAHGVTGDGGIVVESNFSRAGTLFLAEAHGVASLTPALGAAQPGIDFVIVPGPGSSLAWVSGEIGGWNTSNWESAGGFVESDGSGGLRGRFYGTCDLPGYPGSVTFEVISVVDVGPTDIEYVANLGISFSCPS